MKTTDTLVDDIYAMMESKDADPSVDVEAEIEKFGENVKGSNAYRVRQREASR